MRYSAKRKQDVSISTTPIEIIIPLLDPVKIYTAKELAAMPLSKMNEAIAAQESYYLLEHTTKMGGGCDNFTQVITKWRTAHSGQRKIKNPLQDQQRICRASYCPSIGNAWVSQAEWGGS